MIPPRPPPPPSLANPQTAPCPSSPPNQKAPQTHTPTETRIPLSITFDSSHRQNALAAPDPPLRRSSHARDAFTNPLVERDLERTVDGVEGARTGQPFLAHDAPCDLPAGHRRAGLAEDVQRQARPLGRVSAAPCGPGGERLDGWHVGLWRGQAEQGAETCEITHQPHRVSARDV